MNTPLFTAANGFDRAAIMTRAHTIRRFWADSKWGAKPGDMAAAMVMAWRQARQEKAEIAKRAETVATLAAETPEQRATRDAALAAQIDALGSDTFRRAA